MLVFGHTHKPWVGEYGAALFANSGWVGKPKNGDPRGVFAVLRERGGESTRDIERVAYAALAIAREMHASWLPLELADRLVAAA